MKANGMKKSQHCQEISRRRNASLGDQMDVCFDQAGVIMQLLAWVIWKDSRKKIELGGYEQRDSFLVLKSFRGKKRSGYLVFGKGCLNVLRSIYVGWVPCLDIS